MSEKELIIGSSMFILMYSLESTDFRGKRVIKKINRSIKKQLAIARNKDPKSYLDLVYKAAEVIDDVRDELRKEKAIISDIIKPGTMLAFTRFKYPEVFNNLQIPEQAVDELFTKYNEEDYNSTRNTLRFTKRLIDNVIKGKYEDNDRSRRAS